MSHSKSLRMPCDSSSPSSRTNPSTFFNKSILANSKDLSAMRVSVFVFSAGAPWLGPGPGSRSLGLIVARLRRVWERCCPAHHTTYSPKPDPRKIVGALHVDKCRLATLRTPWGLETRRRRAHGLDTPPFLSGMGFWQAVCLEPEAPKART